MPAFLLLVKPFWPMIWRGLAAFALVLAFWWAWGHFVKSPYIAQGVAIEKVHTDQAVAANKTLAADAEVMKGSVARQNKALADLKAEDAARMAAMTKRLAALDAKNKAEAADKKRALDIVNGPPAPNKEVACEDADRILDELLARRLRND